MRPRSFLNWKRLAPGHDSPSGRDFVVFYTPRHGQPYRLPKGEPSMFMGLPSGNVRREACGESKYCVDTVANADWNLAQRRPT